MFLIIQQCAKLSLEFIKLQRSLITVLNNNITFKFFDQYDMTTAAFPEFIRPLSHRQKACTN